MDEGSAIVKKSLMVWMMLVALVGCGGGGNVATSDDDAGDESGNPGTSPVTGTDTVVLAFNDLGMHCLDREFSVFSILPPFNVVHAQVVDKQASGPRLLDSDAAEVDYQAAADADGSVNSTSLGDKTDFWDFADTLFGTTLDAGESLTGLYMPADHPTAPGPQVMTYDAAADWFSAEGIPMTPIDDDGLTNTYPLMRIRAVDPAAANTLASLDIVVPVATETDCRACHDSDGTGTLRPGIAWATDADAEVRTKKNILLLHDAMQGTTLSSQSPVLCSSCHYSRALDLNGSGPTGDQVGNPTFSAVMHDFHGSAVDWNGDPAFPSGAGVDQTCYRCHPGAVTECQRGAMKTGGMECFDCHGGMLAVGGENPLLTDGSLDGTNDGGRRRPWQDLPRCQSCHTGDAVDHLSGTGMELAADGIRLTQAYRTGDDSASPIKAVNRRFAENTDTLFRFSTGHGGIYCEGCHGSTHAVWPNSDPTANDNVAAQQLQGHAGPIIECTACHASGSLARTTNGPHGMHNVNDASWADGGHEHFFENDADGCKACHGTALKGTPLATVAADRQFSIEHGTVTFTQGEQVRCDHCHGLPD
jgi:hypothetical protein